MQIEIYISALKKNNISCCTYTMVCKKLNLKKTESILAKNISDEELLLSSMTKSLEKVKNTNSVIDIFVSNKISKYLENKNYLSESNSVSAELYKLSQYRIKFNISFVFTKDILCEEVMKNLYLCKNKIENIGGNI